MSARGSTGSSESVRTLRCTSSLLRLPSLVTAASATAYVLVLIASCTSTSVTLRYFVFDLYLPRALRLVFLRSRIRSVTDQRRRVPSTSTASADIHGSTYIVSTTL